MVKCAKNTIEIVWWEIDESLFFLSFKDFLQLSFQRKLPYKNVSTQQRSPTYRLDDSLTIMSKSEARIAPNRASDAPCADTWAHPAPPLSLPSNREVHFFEKHPLASPPVHPLRRPHRCPRPVTSASRNALTAFGRHIRGPGAPVYERKALLAV